MADDQITPAPASPTRWPGRVTASELRVVDGDTELVVVTLTIPTSQLGVDSVRLTAGRLRGRGVVLLVDGSGQPVGLELEPRLSTLERALAAQALAAEEERQTIERAPRTTRLAAELAAMRNELARQGEGD